MPKIQNRRRFWKVPYTYSKSCLACYSTVTSRCIEIIYERESKLVKHAPCEGTKTVTKYDESQEELGDVAKGEASKCPRKFRWQSVKQI